MRRKPLSSDLFMASMRAGLVGDGDRVRESATSGFSAGDDELI